MNDLLDVEIILKRNKYSNIYNLGIVILVITVIFMVIVSIFDYQTYLVTEAQIVQDKMKLLIASDDIKYVINNDYLMVDREKYKYKVIEISDEVIYGDDKKFYQYIYLDVLDVLKINNYIYRVSFFKEKKKLINFIKDFL